MATPVTSHIHPCRRDSLGHPLSNLDPEPSCHPSRDTQYPHGRYRGKFTTLPRTFVGTCRSADHAPQIGKLSEDMRKEGGTSNSSGPYQNLWLTRKYGAGQAVEHLFLIVGCIISYDGTATTTSLCGSITHQHIYIHIEIHVIQK